MQMLEAKPERQPGNVRWGLQSVSRDGVAPNKYRRARPVMESDGVTG